MKYIVFSFFLLFSLFFLVFPVHAEEYLVETFVNSFRIGEYIIYDIDDTFYAEKRLFEKLGFNATENLKLETLNNIGTYEFIKNRQKLYITTKEDIFKKRKTKKNDYKTIETPEKNIILKSTDIQFSTYYNNQNNHINYFYNAIASGKIYKLNTDIYLNKDRQGLSIEYPYNTDKIQTISMGYVPNINANGMYISNYYMKRSDDIFETEKIYVTYPINTRIEIYRNNFFLKELIVDKQPYEIELENTYYTNEYILKVYKPDGTTEKKEIKRNVLSYLVKPKTFEYKFAFGQEIGKSNYNHDFNVSYGVNKYLTLNAISTENSFLRSNSLSSTVALSDRMVIQPYFMKRENSDKKENIYGNRFFYNHPVFFFSANTQTDYTNLFFNLNKYQVNASYVSDTTAEKVSIKKYLMLFNRVFNTFEFGHAHPKNEYEKDYYFYNVKSTYFLNLANATISAEYKNTNSVLRRESIELLLNKNFKNQANLNLKTSLQRDEFEKVFKLNETQLMLNLYNHRYISLTLNANYNHKSNAFSGSVMFNFSFDFNNMKITRDNLKEKVIVNITAYEDKNNNQKKDADEEYIDFTILFEGKKIQSENKKITLYLENKDNYFEFENDFEYRTNYDSIKIPKQRSRNEIVNVEIPFYSVDEIFQCLNESESNKYNKAVLLLDDKKVSETSLKFNCYSFFINKSMKERYRVALE